MTTSKEPGQQSVLNIDFAPSFSDMECNLRFIEASATHVTLEADQALSVRDGAQLDVFIPHLGMHFQLLLGFDRHERRGELHRYTMAISDIQEEFFEFALQEVDIFQSFHQILAENADEAEVDLRLNVSAPMDEIHCRLYAHYRTFDFFYNPKFSDWPNGVLFLNTSLEYDEIRRLHLHLLDHTTLSLPCQIVRRIAEDNLRGYQIQVTSLRRGFVDAIDEHMEEKMLETLD